MSEIIGEEWRDIEGFDLLYQVSTYGRVRSKTHTEITRAGWKRVRVGRILKLSQGNGQRRYNKVQLGKGNYRLVHRLVAIAFLSNSDDLPEVNHKNKNTFDNYVDNLEWCSKRENMIHAYDKSFTLYNDKENLYRRFKSIAEAADFLKCNKGNVSRLVRGIKYKHIKGWSFVHYHS